MKVLFIDPIIGPITNATNLSIKKSIFVQVMNRFVDEIETEERTEQKHSMPIGKVFIDTQKLLDLPLPSQKNLY